jgi:hypothetical protein
MSSRKIQPNFKNGVCKIKGFKGRNFKLHQSTWKKHILKDRTRWYLKKHFDKIVETLKKPDSILQSPREGNVASFAKRFEGFYIWNKATVTTYLYVLVNMEDNNIRTVYTNPKLKRWKRRWPKK